MFFATFIFCLTFSISYTRALNAYHTMNTLKLLSLFYNAVALTFPSVKINYFIPINLFTKL